MKRAIAAWIAVVGCVETGSGPTISTNEEAIGEGTTAVPGDVFVSLSNGDVKWFRPDGTLVKTLPGRTTGHAEGMAFDSSGNLYVTHWYSADLLSGNSIEKFDSAGTATGTFGSGYDCNPRSIVFDAAGRAWVGQSDCNTDVLRFDAAGSLEASFDVDTELRGSDCVDLANDQCTVYYTSQGPDVLRYDACTDTQLANFNLLPLPIDLLAGSSAHFLKILRDGRVLVANYTEVVLLSASGVQVRTYDRAGANGWMGLDLDVDGTSFWTSNKSTSEVVQFDIESGSVLAHWNTGTAADTVKAVAIAHAPREVHGRMTGGGSVFTLAGERVTHGFELHCDADNPPNSLEVNWGGHRFHLLGLDSATCTDDPLIDPGQPPAPFDTYDGEGDGRYDGVDGATATWRFTDAGEPGVSDRATIDVWDAAGAHVLTVSNTLTFGNHQAHKD